MPTVKHAKYRGHDIVATVADDGAPSATVDGDDVPVRAVGNQFSATYFETKPDLLEAVKAYVRDLPRRGA